MNVERANNLHQSGDLEGARSAYRAVLQQEPKNVSALNLGVVELKLGDYASAAATIAVAERISPSVSSRNNLAMALAGEGECWRRRRSCACSPRSAMMLR